MAKKRRSNNGKSKYGTGSRSALREKRYEGLGSVYYESRRRDEDYQRQRDLSKNRKRIREPAEYIGYSGAYDNVGRHIKTGGSVVISGRRDRNKTRRCKLEYERQRRAWFGYRSSGNATNMPRIKHKDRFTPSENCKRR